MSRMINIVLRKVSVALTLLFMLFAAPIANAADKNSADSLYAAKQYEAAAEQYAALADSLPSSDVYYNWGNAEYKLKHFGQAVLAYERALRYNPENADAQYNLALVRTHLADRFSKPSEMFFISWFRTWVTSHSVGHWTWLSFLWCTLFFLCLVTYFVGRSMWLRKSGFFAALFCMLCFMLTTIFAVVQRYKFNNNADAVILAEEVQLFASPSTSSKQIRTLHEGTKVTINDMTKGDWLLVELPDGKEGYIAFTNGHLEMVVPVKK